MTVIMNKNITVAIDGPAGAGKSTVAKKMAEMLSFEYIDTGAMYRALTLKILKLGLDPMSVEDVVNTMNSTSIDFKDNHIYLDNIQVDKEIRENIISQNVSYIAKIKEVREGMVRIQQELAKTKSVIMDGRDITTVVLPNADFKFFITASVEERANRRHKELIEKGENNISYEDIKREIENRDKIDSTREIAPLTQSRDSYKIDTTNKTIDECIEEMISIINRR
ncbi:(d)CMP kinase [Tissierella pigra]|nr:(d)CMP kinase [Tissierella pigra]